MHQLVFFAEYGPTGKLHGHWKNLERLQLVIHPLLDVDDLAHHLDCQRCKAESKWYFTLQDIRREISGKRNSESTYLSKMPGEVTTKISFKNYALMCNVCSSYTYTPNLIMHDVKYFAHFVRNN